MEIERAYALKVEEIERLREQIGLSLGGLAYEADVHPTTLRRWYKGGLAFMSNVKLLADALDTTPDQIILKEEQVEEDEVVKPEPPRKRVKITTNKYDLENFNEAELVKAIIDAIRTSGDIIVVKVEKGSIIVTLEMERGDYMRFLMAIARGDLDSLGIIRVQDAVTGREIKGEIIGDVWHDTEQMDAEKLEELRREASRGKKKGEKRKQEDS